MTDMIRRSDALAACQGMDPEGDINNLPAVTVGVPTDCRKWPFYPIQMPTTKDGKGPATIGVDAASVSYEVWDWEFNTYASFEHLPDAINEAMRLSLAALEPVAVQCCMCGKRDLSTAEDGGPECELPDGRWVCSSQCYDTACGKIPHPAPRRASGPLPADGFATSDAEGQWCRDVDAGVYAEPDPAAIREAALREAADAINERGKREQEDFGLTRATQNFYRARDLVRSLIQKGAAE